MNLKIKALLIMPGKEPQLVKIPSNTKFFKSFIGDNLYKIRLDENALMISDGNASIDDFNRLLNGDIVLGTFVIVGLKNKHRVSLNKKQIRKYNNVFKLRKHLKKINYYKTLYLSKYYNNIKVA